MCDLFLPWIMGLSMFGILMLELYQDVWRLFISFYESLYFMSLRLPPGNPVAPISALHGHKPGRF